jgi:hypothetical protein
MHLPRLLFLPMFADQPPARVFSNAKAKSVAVTEQSKREGRC